MPDLQTSLQGRDLGHLRIIAEHWGLDLTAPDARVGLQRLIPALLDRFLLEEVVETLPADCRRALDDLLQNEGRIAWATFTRRYGTLREMGPARRDRERPDLVPTSPTEILWYHALIARAFFETPEGALEHAYIPDDLIPLLPNADAHTTIALGHPATPAQRAYPLPATDQILDDACTLLAALRLNLAQPLYLNLPDVPLRALLQAADILTPAGEPNLENLRVFLEAARPQALLMLAQGWLNSPTCNDLRLIPGLQAEGDWQNDPLQTRQILLDLLSAVPAQAWWSLPAFVSAVQQTAPDFQRPAGNFDTWYLRDETSGKYLIGYENWDSVEGALIRYVICGPLHWLGFVDLAAPQEGASPQAFRFSRWSAALFRGEPPVGLPPEEETLLVNSAAQVRAPRLVPRSIRYQIARFSEWEAPDREVYRYRITTASLERARQQGLTTQHLLTLLRKHALALPPALLKALERWETRGSEIRFEQVLLLRVSTPEILQALRASKATRFLGDPLGPTAIIVKSGAGTKVLAFLAEMGYLSELPSSTFVETKEDS